MPPPRESNSSSTQTSLTVTPFNNPTMAEETLSEQNPTLRSHTLLIISPFPSLPQTFLPSLSRKFPDLRVIYHQQDWNSTPVPAVEIPRDVWEDVTILLTFSTLPLPEEAPRLQYVQLMSAGVEHVYGERLYREWARGGDVEEGGRWRGFCTANGVHGPQISEWIISTYLAFEHRFPLYLQQQKEARWNRGNMLTMEDAVDKTIGILGYGSIGRQTARVASALGMRVHAYTLHPRPDRASRRDKGWTPPGLGDPDGTIPSQWFSGSSPADLHAFLSSGLDLLVICTPLTSQTQHLLSKTEFEILAGNGRKGKTFISNIARGPVIHTDDLIEALESGMIRGAALDVTDPEPLPDGHPLWGAKNVIITPHVSGASTRYFERVLGILEYNLGRLSKGEELVNRVDRERGY
ncbi:hypothetical protein VTI74DRAFT_11634 [Chaetomium olivicolor]